MSSDYKIGAGIGLGVIILIVTILAGCPRYNVWRSEMAGKAELAQAEFNRRIKIAEAEASKEAAKNLAQAEIERAKGVAEANKIIGQSLQNNESYLRYLWVQGLNDESSQVIYVPTEAGLPILEAGKRSNR